MIKVTLKDGTAKYINPDFIIAVSTDYNDGAFIDTTIDHHGNSIHVKESPEKIIEKINIMKLSELTIFESIKKLDLKDITEDSIKNIIHTSAKVLIP